MKQLSVAGAFLRFSDKGRARPIASGWRVHLEHRHQRYFVVCPAAPSKHTKSRSRYCGPTRNARHAPEGHWADRPELSLLVTHSDLGRVGSCFAAIDRPHPAIRQAGSA